MHAAHPAVLCLFVYKKKGCQDACVYEYTHKREKEAIEKFINIYTERMMMKNAVYLHTDWWCCEGALLNQP